jgi:hypothetical protein
LVSSFGFRVPGSGKTDEIQTQNPKLETHASHAVTRTRAQ